MAVHTLLGGRILCLPRPAIMVAPASSCWCESELQGSAWVEWRGADGEAWWGIDAVKTTVSQ
ncbi:hypothetical protein IG631_10639 [Alternaria alternata]|nr:hypothetical protein IG631_10639 [Alternaria alternata]